MKTTKLILPVFIAALIISCSNNTSETKPQSSVTVNGITTSTFKIWGNCETCKKTIESSLKVDGIAKADWNVDSKIMTVEYDSSKISLDKIEKNIANVGYDTEKYRGDDKAYSELPECCQYERK